MAHYIDKSAVVAEIERKADIICQGVLSEEATMSVEYFKDSLISFLDTLEVKEVDLEKEFDKCCENYIFDDESEVYTAKHFFELGLKASNPITAADRGTAEKIIINLKRVEKDYRIDLTREIEWLRNKVKKGY